MEDLKAYIESGILELYALGELTRDERLEVELMLDKYPQIRQELAGIEDALLAYSMENAIDPDEALRSRILNVLTVVDGSPDVSGETEKGKSEMNTRSITTRPNVEVRHVAFYRYAFAASIALLLISLVAVFSLNRRLQESNRRIAVLEQAEEKFTNRINYTEGKLAEVNEALTIFRQPEKYRLVNLKGTPKAPEASMKVAFDPLAKVVMIDNGSMNMPEYDAAHQYQLWALVDGKPVDLGVFDVKPGSGGMIKMKSVQNAQAFAVTLEVKGGSPVPTMEQMIVMGTI